MSIKKVFYWNCADNKNHTHQRIEWAIKNKFLVCINIVIEDKLFNKVKKDDLILAYEPKGHKISKFENGNDGFCMACDCNRFDGKQSFTNAFTIIDAPIMINSYEEYIKYNELIFQNWFSDIKFCRNLETYNNYFKTYFENKHKIYLFPIRHSGKLKKEISTNTNSENELKYYGNIRKGFNIFDDIYLNKLLINNKLF
jgi:hypothetical protein